VTPLVSHGDTRAEGGGPDEVAASSVHLDLRAAAGTYRVIEIPAGGTVSGRVTLSGPPPVLPPIALSRRAEDRALCGDTLPDARVRADGTGGVANALVYLSDIGAGLAPLPLPAKAPVAFEHCVLEPTLQIVPLGTPLALGNHDDVLAMIALYAPGGEWICAYGMPYAGMEFATAKMVTAKAGLWEVRSPGRPGIAAHVFVTPHPYAAMSGESGEFAITGVPAGTYRVRMWHPGWRPLLPFDPEAMATPMPPGIELERRVVVTAGAITRADFVLPAALDP